MRSTLGTWALIACVSGCGAHATEPTTTGESSGGEERPMHVALAALRPAGAERVLVPLREAPQDPARYLDAARFYAVTDVAGMTLLWGLTYGAMGAGLTDEVGHRALAEAMLAVLRERVSMTTDGAVRRVTTHLAPGAVPLIVEDGVGRSPVAHLFELRVTPALSAWSGGGYDLAELITIVRNLAVVGPNPLGLDAYVEVLGYLHDLENLGLLEAFAAWLFGPAFEPAWAGYAGTHSDSVETMRHHLERAPFRPSHAVLPDDLVAFP